MRILVKVFTILMILSLLTSTFSTISTSASKPTPIQTPASSHGSTKSN